MCRKCNRKNAYWRELSNCGKMSHACASDSMVLTMLCEPRSLEASRDGSDDKEDDADADDDPLRGTTTTGDMAIRRPATCSSGDRISDAESEAAEELADDN